MTMLGKMALHDPIAEAMAKDFELQSAIHMSITLRAILRGVLQDRAYETALHVVDDIIENDERMRRIMRRIIGAHQ